MHLSAPFQILSIFVQLENHMKKFLFLALMLAMLVTAALAEPQLSGVFADDVTLTSGEDGWFVEFEASENGTVAMGCFALVGACVGFLKFNKHPAKIFMGDTGSMFIGGMMVASAMLTKTVFLLIPICFTCIMSSVSVMMQTTYFKYTRKKYGQGRRIFKMSPIHHHFELCGMKEVQVVAMYFAVTLLLSAVALVSVVKFF